MLKEFNIQIPLSLQDSFDLLCKSGNDIISWQTNTTDFEKGYIEWKQSMWSLTGSCVITAALKATKEKETSVVIRVHKPLQIADPLKLCNKVFRRFDVVLKNNLIDFEKHTF